MNNIDFLKKKKFKDWIMGKAQWRKCFKDEWRINCVKWFWEIEQGADWELATELSMWRKLTILTQQCRQPGQGESLTGVASRKQRRNKKHTDQKWPVCSPGTPEGVLKTFQWVHRVKNTLTLILSWGCSEVLQIPCCVTTSLLWQLMVRVPVYSYAFNCSASISNMGNINEHNRNKPQLFGAIRCFWEHKMVLRPNSLRTSDIDR